MNFKWCHCALLACAAVSAPALGQVEFYTDGSRIDTPIDVATFDSFVNGDTLVDYREAGLRIHCNDFAFVFAPCNFTAQNYYPNGGVNEMINITREDGDDFGHLEMIASDGWGQCANFVWIQAYDDGVLVDEFDADVAAGRVFGLEGTFDEVRIAAYFDAATRDLHDPTQLNAIALDNVAYDGEGGGGLVLDVDGSCPGNMDFNVTGATPNSNVAIIYAFGTGNQTIPGGPCAGTQLGLNSSARLGGLVMSDGSGFAQLSRSVPGGACGRVFVQALDVATCSTSNVFGL